MAARPIRRHVAKVEADREALAETLGALDELCALRLEALTPQTVSDALYAAGNTYPSRGIARLTFGLNYYLSGGVFELYEIIPGFALSAVAIVLCHHVVICLSTSRQILLSETSNAVASLCAMAILTWTLPSSIELTYVRWMPALSAKSSWDRPNFWRYFRTAIPKDSSIFIMKG